MNVMSFLPEFSKSKNLDISLSSQSVDLATTSDQVLITNTSTGAISVKWAASSGGALTAAFTEGNGLILPAESSAVFSLSSVIDRFAVIGSVANGKFQVTPGVGL